MQTLEFNFRIMKIVKTIEYHKRINKNNENHRIQCENYENHENHLVPHEFQIRIQWDLHGNNKKLRI